MRGSGLGWSDLGEPCRVLSILARIGPKTDHGGIFGEGWLSGSDSLNRMI